MVRRRDTLLVLWKLRSPLLPHTRVVCSWAAAMGELFYRNRKTAFKRFCRWEISKGLGMDLIGKEEVFSLLLELSLGPAPAWGQILQPRLPESSICLDTGSLLTGLSWPHCYPSECKWKKNQVWHLWRNRFLPQDLAQGTTAHIKLQKTAWKPWKFSCVGIDLEELFLATEGRKQACRRV